MLIVNEHKHGNIKTSRSLQLHVCVAPSSGVNEPWTVHGAEMQNIEARVILSIKARDVTKPRKRRKREAHKATLLNHEKVWVDAKSGLHSNTLLITLFSKHLMTWQITSIS